MLSSLLYAITSGSREPGGIAANINEVRHMHVCMLAIIYQARGHLFPQASRIPPYAAPDGVLWGVMEDMVAIYLPPVVCVRDRIRKSVLAIISVGNVYVISVGQCHVPKCFLFGAIIAEHLRHETDFSIATRAEQLAPRHPYVNSARYRTACLVYDSRDDMRVSF